MLSYVHSDCGSSLISSELKHWFLLKRITTNRITPCNLTGNGRIERYNGTIWKSMLLTLKSPNLPRLSWKRDLTDALHATRSLLSTSSNCSPHERLFNFQQRSSSRSSIPSWLVNPGPLMVSMKFIYSPKKELENKINPIEQIILKHQKNLTYKYT
ncbi:uncharacterized protein LOC136080408 [Hydra vulgaris]|uniref:Uncharacterized protein LOC136080408 n=1 Tax=Hydra vulgaris TaxID=6087 RepID=A0ABM4BVA9_HYDVU